MARRRSRSAGDRARPRAVEPFRARRACRPRDPAAEDGRGRPHAERPLDFGTDARCDGEPETDGVSRHDDVGVEDRSIDVVATDRLQRDLGGEVGVGNGVEDRSGARMARYSGSERPAWRMNQTGTRSWGSPRQAWMKGWLS